MSTFQLVLRIDAHASVSSGCSSFMPSGFVKLEPTASLLVLTNQRFCMHFASMKFKRDTHSELVKKNDTKCCHLFVDRDTVFARLSISPPCRE